MILFFLSFFWLVICLSSFFLLKNKKAGYFGTIQILLVLSIFDTAIPGVLWSIYGFNQAVDWKNNLSEFELIKGLSFYIAFYLLMLLFYYWTSILNNEMPIKRSLVINEKRFLKIALLVVFLWILTLFLQIQAAGGVSEYFIKKAIQRWSGGLSETDNSNLLLTVLNIFKWDFIINAIALLGLYNLSNFKFTFFWKYLLPLLCLIIAALTFFRGAIVTVFVGFFFISYLNNRNKKIKIKLNLSKLIAFSIAILFFFIFSLTRDSLNREHTNSDEIANKGSYFYDLFSQGSGIEAVSHIVSRYGNDLEYFYGKTYFDMLLLPIPRSIYTTKPEWYGIDDITRKMGWAESSQSAVTLPGEAYANFGWFGILLAPFLGMFFSKLNNFLSRDDSPLFVIYPCLVITGVMVSNWMAFTGIMNQVITFVILYLLLKFIIEKHD
jgi:oligosaccharide repeat unit polymerase